MTRLRIKKEREERTKDTGSIRAGFVAGAGEDTTQLRGALSPWGFYNKQIR